MNKNINKEKEEEEILYLNRELNRKNIEVKNLQKRILNLIDEKQFLLNEINILKNQNDIIKIKSEKIFNDNKVIYDKKEKELLSIINNLEKVLKEKEKNEINKNDNLRKKLSKANEEINNLKIMNNNRDNILLLINHFFENIKNNLNLNYELHLDFIPYIFDKASFVNNLKVLENEIINKITNNNKEKLRKENKAIKNNKENKQKMIFMNRFIKKTKKKININLKTKKGNKYFRTPPRLYKDNNKTNIDENNISSYILNTNNDFFHSRLNNTIE